VYIVTRNDIKIYLISLKELSKTIMEGDVEMIEMYCDPDVGMVRDLGWDENGFEDFRMVAIDTIGDGNCYFHAVTHAFYIPYRTQTLDGRTISRRQIVRDLRDSLAKRLGEPVDPLNPSGPTFYNELSRGKLQVGEEDYQVYVLESSPESRVGDLRSLFDNFEDYEIETPNLELITRFTPEGVEAQVI